MNNNVSESAVPTSGAGSNVETSLEMKPGEVEKLLALGDVWEFSFRCPRDGFVQVGSRAERPKPSKILDAAGGFAQQVLERLCHESKVDGILFVEGITHVDLRGPGLVAESRGLVSIHRLASEAPRFPQGELAFPWTQTMGNLLYEVGDDFPKQSERIRQAGGIDFNTRLVDPTPEQMRSAVWRVFRPLDTLGTLLPVLENVWTEEWAALNGFGQSRAELLPWLKFVSDYYSVPFATGVFAGIDFCRPTRNISLKTGISRDVPSATQPDLLKAA